MRPTPTATDGAPDPIPALAAEYEAARQRHIEARHAVPAAKHRHAELTRKRQKAADAAAATGEMLAEDKSIAKALLAVSTAEEMVEATSRVMHRAELAVATAVAEAAPAWLEQIAVDRAEVVARIVALAGELDDGLGHLAEIEALPAWVAATVDRVTRGDYLGGALPPMRTRETVLAGVDVGPALAKLVANLPGAEPDAAAA